MSDIEKLCDYFEVSSDYMLLGRDGVRVGPPIIQVSLNYDKTIEEALENRKDIRRNEDRLAWLLLYKFIEAKVEFLKDKN